MIPGISSVHLFFFPSNIFFKMMRMELLAALIAPLVWRIATEANLWLILFFLHKSRNPLQLNCSSLLVIMALDIPNLHRMDFHTNFLMMKVLMSARLEVMHCHNKKLVLFILGKGIDLTS